MEEVNDIEPTTQIQKLNLLYKLSFSTGIFVVCISLMDYTLAALIVTFVLSLISCQLHYLVEIDLTNKSIKKEWGFLIWRVKKEYAFSQITGVSVTPSTILSTVIAISIIIIVVWVALSEDKWEIKMFNFFIAGCVIYYMFKLVGYKIKGQDMFSGGNCPKTGSDWDSTWYNVRIFVGSKNVTIATGRWSSAKKICDQILQYCEI